MNNKLEFDYENYRMWYIIYIAFYTILSIATGLLAIFNQIFEMIIFFFAHIVAFFIQRYYYRKLLSVGKLLRESLPNR